jgi:ankyrin repeat protein
MTPLMFDSQAGHLGVVRWLLDAGAAMDEVANVMWTALALASKSGHPPVVRCCWIGGPTPAPAGI